MVRWLAQQLAQQKGLQYITGGCSTKRLPSSAISSRKVPCCKAFRHLSSESPILTRPALERRLFPICPTPQIQSHVVAVWAPQALFFSCVRVPPRHPADPQIKVARPIVARFETKAITSPDYPFAVPLLSNFFLSPVSPWPPCSHHPHFASRTPDCRAHPFGIRATLLVSL